MKLGEKLLSVSRRVCTIEDPIYGSTTTAGELGPSKQKVYIPNQQLELQAFKLNLISPPLRRPTMPILNESTGKITYLPVLSNGRDNYPIPNLLVAG